MVRNFITAYKLSFPDRLTKCRDVCCDLGPLVNALADIFISQKSAIYPELMYLVASECERYLEYYYNDDGGKENDLSDLCDER